MERMTRTRNEREQRRGGSGRVDLLLALPALPCLTRRRAVTVEMQIIRAFDLVGANRPRERMCVCVCACVRMCVE